MNGTIVDLTISIVNWNVRAYLEKCLESIFRYSEGIKLEVFVVDNASSDNSASMVQDEFPCVTLIENKENIGYGSAHNQVFKTAGGRYILCLNPDTELLPDTLRRMMEFMESHLQAGAASCIELIQKGDRIIPLGRRDYRLWRFYRFINRIFPGIPVRNMYINFISKMLKTPPRLIQPYFIENGFLFLRAAALRQVGEFDSCFFFGNEAKDLTQRMAKAGWRLYIVPQINVIHYDGKSREQLSDAEMAELAKNYKNNRNSV